VNVIPDDLTIGFDAKRLFNNTTGLGNYSRTIVKNLYQHFPQNNYTLFSPKIKQNNFNENFVDNTNFNKVSANTIFKNYWRSYGITQTFKANNIQIFHGLSNELPFNIKKSSTKSVLTVHDLIFEKLPKTYPLMDRLIYHHKVKTSCKNADRIIAISENTKQDIIKHYKISPQKIDVVYQSCNCLFFSSENQTKSLEKFQNLNLPNEYLLYVGSVTPRKNLKTLLEALTILSPSTQLPLLIVGQGKSYKNEMQQLSHKLKVDHLLFWLDNINDTHVLMQLYKNAEALIYPSLYEGFGLPVVEALLCKTPVITGNNSSLKEAGGPSSYYINVLDKDEIKEAIELVLTDNDMKIIMQNEGYEYATKNFNSSVTSKNIMRVYEKALYD